MKNIVTILTIIGTLFSTSAKEGMWIPMLLNHNIAEMQAMGCELTAEDIYSINHSSLKDAIVSFGGFCTGEFISNQGLVLTNHHCGYGQIQKHSSVEHNYLKDGFWANNKGEELENPGLFVEQLVYMEDVTNSILSAVNAEAEISELISAKKAEDEGLNYEIVPYFYGNQYYLLATKKYNDVRLVGAPPSSIGKYGADTDNWVFPRHTGDFSLFRVYENGQPFVPAQNLKVNVAPRTPGEFTMVFGYPGRTQEYLPAVAVDQLVNTENARRVEVRTTLLEIMDGFMRSDEAVKIQYASKYASIANGWKKWIGQIEGIEFSNGIDRKRRLEADFTARIAKDPVLWDKYSGLLDELAVAYTELGPSAMKRNEFIECLYYGMQWFNPMFRMQGAEGESLRNALIDFEKDYNRNVSEATTAAMYEMLVETMPAFIEDAEQGGGVSWSAEIHNEIDQLIAEAKKGTLEEWPSWSYISTFTKQSFGAFRDDFGADYAVANAKVQELQAKYMQALIEAFPEVSFYPDANSTLRLTYGKLEGVSPRDAVTYGTTTYLDGAMAKYKPGDYEFDLPARLIELYENKDYGTYAENGKLPVCNIASNHTTGGNSGSPVLNGKGELIGLNFDRIWEGTMSDVNFDAEICRNIMVDSRYVLFIIDKFAGQQWLIEEMELVQ